MTIDTFSPRKVTDLDAVARQLPDPSRLSHQGRHHRRAVGQYEGNVFRLLAIELRRPVSAEVYGIRDDEPGVPPDVSGRYQIDDFPARFLFYPVIDGPARDL